MDTMDKGALLYEMPEAIYLNNRDQGISNLIVSITGICMIIGLIMFCIWLSRYARAIIILLLLIFLLSYLISLLPKEIRESPLYRFKIYEKGFIPCTKPFKYIWDNREYFIPFDEIKEIWYYWAGSAFSIVLKEKGNTKAKKKRNEVDIRPYHDIGGYLKLSFILKRKFPDERFPDFRIVYEDFIAFQDRLKNKITREEYLEVYERLTEVNKEFY
jgi:hypothetical protein